MLTKNKEKLKNIKVQEVINVKRKDEEMVVGKFGIKSEEYVKTEDYVS